MDRDEEAKRARRAELNRKLRQDPVQLLGREAAPEFAAGALFGARDELLRRYPGDLPER